MKTATLLAGLALALLPISAPAAPAHKMPAKKMAVATTYQCQKCHMHYTAAQAKKNHYKDPMDGGNLLPVKPSGSQSHSMSGMKM